VPKAYSSDLRVRVKRPEIGDHLTREMAAKVGFLLARCQLRVSEECMVGPSRLARDWALNKENWRFAGLFFVRSFVQRG
jgi:hypothetical protein